MIRTLLPFDLVRYALPAGSGGGNRAFTLDSLGRGISDRVSTIKVPALSLSLLARQAQAVAWIEGRRVAAIGAARPRSGPRTWEVSHLLLTPGDLDRVDLLSVLTQRIARQGGERVFVRLLSDDPLVDAVKSCGFFPCSREILYRTWRRRTAESLGPRRKTPADEFAIYQLYTSATPLETRLSTGVTFEQWAAARERTGGRSREFVVDAGSGVTGWLKTVRRLRWSTATLMVRPEDASTAAGLVDFALESLPRRGGVLWPVPEHQTVLQRVMWQRGYEVDSEYVTLVRSMVSPAMEKENRAAVPIPPA